MARRILELVELHRALRPERVIRDRRDPLEIFSDAELLQRYRFTRDGIMYITDIVAGDIAHNTRRSSALLPYQQVFIALQYHGSGSFQRIVGDPIQVSQSTASRAIHRVTESLSSKVNTFIRFPENAELQISKEKFYNIRQFPGVFGCVDGTHVWIIAPHNNEVDFVNRKNYHSINTQVICDATGKWINIVARWPGSAHDSRILRSSQVWDMMENGAVNGIILGDSGYPCKSWLMTPLMHANNVAERRYNSAHKHTRVLVEQAIGRWKRRFHVLHGENRMKDPNDNCKVIAATAVLHNVVIGRNEPAQPDIEHVQPQPNEEQYIGLQNGHIARNILINTHFAI